ncbi:MAG TPA: hypothetical protein VIT67_16565 [Povalibacter sp.]
MSIKSIILNRLAHISMVALTLTAQTVLADSPLFDSHVHLWHDEESLRSYE